MWGNLGHLAGDYLHAAISVVQRFAAMPIDIGVIVAIAIVLILIRIYIGGFFGWLIRYVAYVGLYWKLVHFQPFMSIFPHSDPIDLHTGLIPVSKKLIVAINNGQYAAYIIAVYLLVAFWVPVGIIGGLLRWRRRRARSGGYSPARGASAGGAGAAASGDGQPFDVVRREGESKQTMVIMMTDIKGYSARMEKDEAATFALLKEHNVIMRRAITTNRGKEIKTIGDAFMVVFQHPIDAVRCGMAMQKGLFDFNKPRAANDHLLVRIGIYQGEVIVTQKDVFGEGVNIAARMESITDPGGISISKDIYEAIKGKVEAGFQSVGIPKMKNIASPPEVFKIHLTHS
ncbi:MAG TPA: adenylate/guanylate cyclase domain-containing protein [Magnetospirillaceae bacterium]